MISGAAGSGDHRPHDTALRHKIRNLRAKVRLLLPLDLCAKEQRRSKNLIKMDHNRRLDPHPHPARWNFAKESLSELYVPDHPPALQKHLFEKLTPAELEQIKEDKLYYVGEEFLEQFDQFLEARQRDGHPPVNPQRRHSRPHHHHQQREKEEHQQQREKEEHLLQSIPELNHKSSLSVGEEQLAQKESVLERRMKREVRVEGIQAKRKFITEEDLTRRAYIKVRGRENMERHLLNHARACRDKQHAIRERSQANMLRTAQSYKRRGHPFEAGEITSLSEQLRTLCLMRHSKSAKLLCRE